MKSIDKLREIASRLDDAASNVSEHGFSPIAIKASLLCDEIEAEIEDLELLIIDGYPEPFNTPDAMHMVLGTAADNFDTPEEAVGYLRGDTSMLLPVDADGGPIHVGDVVNWYGNTLDVSGICEDSIWFEPRDSTQEWKCIFSNTCHHVKPDTIKELLKEFVVACWPRTDEKHFEPEIDEYADRFRELLGGDAE